MLDFLTNYIIAGLIVLGIKIAVGNFSFDKDDPNRTIDGRIDNLFKNIEAKYGKQPRLYKDAIIFVSFALLVFIWPLIALNIFGQLGEMIGKNRK